MQEIEKGALALFCFLLLGASIGFKPSHKVDESGFQSSQDGKVNEAFPHNKGSVRGLKGHNQMECSECHDPAKKPTDQPQVKDFQHSACIKCHNFAAEVFRSALNRSNIFCGVCHSGRPVSKSQPALFREFPKQTISDFGITFSHPAHLKRAKDGLPAKVTFQPGAFFKPQLSPDKALLCMDCHKSVAAHKPDIKTETNHKACFVCHGVITNKPRKNFPYMDDCAGCHNVEAARVPLKFTEVPLFKHDEHDYDIRPKKKADLKIPKPIDRLCSECHKVAAQAENLKAIRLPDVSHCELCHNGKIGLPDPLKNNILESLKKH